MEEEMMNSETKIFLLRGSDDYYIGEVSELEEEPAFFVENVFQIVDGYAWGTNEEDAIGRISKSDKFYHITSSAEESLFYPVGKEPEEGEKKTSWEIEYISMRRFPKYTPQRHMFLTTDQIMTILDPEPEVLDLYRKTAG